jgi:hypothetical protein
MGSIFEKNGFDATEVTRVVDRYFELEKGELEIK